MSLGRRVRTLEALAPPPPPADCGYLPQSVAIYGPLESPEGAAALRAFMGPCAKCGRPKNPRRGPCHLCAHGPGEDSGMRLASRIGRLEKAAPQEQICPGCGHGDPDHRFTCVVPDWPPAPYDPADDFCSVCGRRCIFRITADKDG